MVGLRNLMGLGLAATAPLAGCAAIGDARAPLLASAYTSAPASELEASALDAWWTAFGDPQLVDLVEAALANSPDARAAEAALAEAEAIRNQAVRSLWPLGGISSRAETQDVSLVSGTAPAAALGRTDSVLASFNVSWELDLLGRSALGARVAAADLAGARFRREAARTAIAAGVADALFVVRGSAAQYDDALETLRIQRSVFDITDARVKAGIAPQTDADRVRADLLQSEAEADRLKAEFDVSRRILLVLLGRGDATVDSIEARAELAAPVAPPVTLPTDLLSRRPDVREAAQRVISAAGVMELSERALFPTFTLLPGAGLNSSSRDGEAQTTTGFWFLGVGVSTPVLDLPRLMAQAKARSARFEQAAIAYEQTALGALGEADNALTRLAADIRRERLLTSAEQQARALFDARTELYRAGLDDLQDFLDAERTWRLARTNLTAVRTTALRRSVAAFKAVGGGWAPPAQASVSRAADAASHILSTGQGTDS